MSINRVILAKTIDAIHELESQKIRVPAHLVDKYREYYRIVHGKDLDNNSLNYRYRYVSNKQG